MGPTAAGINDLVLNKSEQENIFKLAQWPARSLLISFLENRDSERQCSVDVKQPIQEDYDKKIAKQEAIHLFGDGQVLFLAVERSLPRDQGLDMPVFNVSAFGYIGEAAKTFRKGPDSKATLADRTFSGDHSHIVWSVIEIFESDIGCIIEEIDISLGKATALDLEPTRIIDPNDVPEFPAPRSQLIQCATIYRLMQHRDEPTTVPYIVEKIGANKERRDKISREVDKFQQPYSLLRKDNNNYYDYQQDNGRYHLKDRVALCLGRALCVLRRGYRTMYLSLKMADILCYLITEVKAR